MDTFWESVKREERAVTRKRVLIIAGVVMVALAVIVPPIAARHQEPAAVCETQNPVAVCETQEPAAVCEKDPVAVCETQGPGTLPDSPFYFVKDWKRSIRLSFAFDTRGKAALALGFAGEDALAINALCDKGEYVHGGKQCGKFQVQFHRALVWIEEAKEEGENVEQLADKLERDHLWQQRVLAAALGKVPEWAKEAVLNAIVNSSSALENTIEKIEGKQAVEQFQKELNLQFSSLDEEMQIRIRERLKIATEATESVADSVTTAPNVPAPINQQPVITRLMADEGSLSPKESCRIECYAEDPDGDSLSYEWSASKGDISGTGPVITWTAPKRDGSYDITVVVSDGQGGEATRAVTIDVELPPSPKIKELVVTPNTPKYFAEVQGRYVILQGKSCELECVVEDTSAELDYEWEAPRGEFSGTGSRVTWTAPGGKGEVVVTVTVSDSSGRVDSDSVFFRISTCSQCFS
jgi:hypothetical protein